MISFCVYCCCFCLFVFITLLLPDNFYWVNQSDVKTDPLNAEFTLARLTFVFSVGVLTEASTF